MKSIKRLEKLFWLAIGCMFGMSITVLFMPLATSMASATNRFSFIITGGVFWIFMIMGYILLFFAYREFKSFMYEKFGRNTKLDGKPGFITFFANVPATIIDIIFPVSLIIIIIIQFTPLKSNYIVYVFLFLLIFSLNMHGMFNGRIYKITKCKRLRREESHE